jgi:hypothetical protein
MRLPICSCRHQVNFVVAPQVLKLPALLEGVRQAVVQLAFLAQGITTIFLYIRRPRNDAVALVNQRILELACGGVAVAILTIAIVIRTPVFVNALPDAPKSSLHHIVVSVGSARIRTRPKATTLFTLSKRAYCRRC